MALKLRFGGHGQLWAEIVLSRGDRVFIATPEHFELGTLVPLTLEAPELSSPLVVTATVVGHRPATPNSQAGLVVSVGHNMVERVEGALSAAGPSDVPVVKSPSRITAERQFSARIVIPRVIEGCSVKTLTTSTMTLTTPTQLPVEETVVIALQLPDGEVQVSAVVNWARPELSLMGLRVGTLDPMALTRIKRALDADQKTSSVSAMSSGFTVVVADDEPSILDLLSRIISTAGHRVVRAERGDQALQLIRQERPKLVFLDVLMPGLDGLEVCAAVRADQSLGRTPIVLLSAMGEQTLLETVRSSKASDFLTKPMKAESVRAILSKYL